MWNLRRWRSFFDLCGDQTGRGYPDGKDTRTNGRADAAIRRPPGEVAYSDLGFESRSWQLGARKRAKLLRLVTLSPILLV